MKVVDWDELQGKLISVCSLAMEERIFSGCVVGCEVDGVRRVWPLGRDDYDGLGAAMHSTRVFDIASLTKVVPTSTLALLAIARGDLDLQAPVAEFIPEFAAHHNDEARIFHLLTHSLDYRFPLSSLKDLPAEELFARLCAHPFTAAPGSLFNYGNAASLLLGRVLNRLTGLSLQELGQKTFFAPLGMVDSGWEPLSRVDLERVVPTEICPWRGRLLRGEIHDESAYALRTMGPVGSAGMFSTVPDLLTFMRFVQERAELLKLICENQLSHLPGQCTGLGWELDNKRFMGRWAGPRAFGKTGFTGQSIVCDPDRQATLVLLCNFTWPQREKKPDRIYAVRAALADLFFGVLG